MVYSILDDKTKKPTDKSLEAVLAKNYKLWVDITTHCDETYDNISLNWVFAGEKYGWLLKILKKKRVIVNLVPNDKFVKIGCILGGKAMEAIKKIELLPETSTIIKSAPKYGEGYGVEIDLKYKKQLKDIFKLIKIKIDN